MSWTACLKIPSVILRMFPLWTKVNLFLLFEASSKANLATLSEAALVMIIMAMPGLREVTLGRLRAGRTLAYRSKIVLSVTATLLGDPGSSGVVIGPLRQAAVPFSMSTVFWGRLDPYVSI